MVEEGKSVVELRDDFYRDSFGKMTLIIFSFCLAIGLLVAMSFYLYLAKPLPVTFAVADEWRVRPPVPLDQPYLSVPDMLQWVGDVVPKVFVYDFNRYNDQLKVASQYFTPEGWKIFLNQLNIYANYNNVQTYKQFITSAPAGAPFILNQGLLSGKYAWWVQMPITLSYQGNNQSAEKTLTLQVLLVRVSTLDNLIGVAIDNVIVANGAERQQTGTG